MGGILIHQVEPKKGNAGDSYTITSSTTLYAQWTKANRTCTVTKAGTTNSDWVATYSCVKGTGTMTACSYKGTVCVGGSVGSSSELSGC